MQVRVVGIAAAGNSALDHLIPAGPPGLDLAALDTDLGALQRSRAPIRIPLGQILTRGLAARANPRLGERAAEESAHDLFHLCRSAAVVLIAADLAATARACAIASVSAFGLAASPRRQYAGPLPSPAALPA
jgi:cell division protein FtsZ